MKVQSRLLSVLSVAGVILLAAFIGMVYAFSTGRVGFSGNPNVGGGLTCAVCHSGGQIPAVVLDGPTTVEPGETVEYTLTISGGQEVAGGFNVSATGGDLATLPGATDTQILPVPGGFPDELTHTMPKDADSSGAVEFRFEWTAPDSSQTVTLYGAGNSVDLDGSSQGDAPNTDTLKITVGTSTFTDSSFLPFVIGG